MAGLRGALSQKERAWAWWFVAVVLGLTGAPTSSLLVCYRPQGWAYIALAPSSAGRTITIS